MERGRWHRCFGRANANWGRWILRSAAANRIAVDHRAQDKRVVGVDPVGKLPLAAPPLQGLRANIAERVRRVMKEPVKVLGSYSQILNNNWKLYMDNVKDSYHASLLHLFFTTFHINRLSQTGGVIVGGDGGHHVSYSMTNTGTRGAEYERDRMRSANAGFGLEAPGLLESVDEIGDGVTLQILSVFPGFVLQQIFNSLAVRQIIPRGIDRSELVWTCFGYASDDAAMTARRRLTAAHPIEQVGAKLREMMPWIKQRAMVDKSKN